MFREPTQTEKQEFSIPSGVEILEYFERSAKELGISRTALGQQAVGYSKLHRKLCDGRDIRLSTLRGLIGFVNAQKAQNKNAA